MILSGDVDFSAARRPFRAADLFKRTNPPLWGKRKTTGPSVAFRLRVLLPEVLNQLSWLADQGLVRQTGKFPPRGPHYALTEAGASHPEYRPDATKARPVPLPVRSDRVREVLSYLADHGPARIRDLRDRLNIPHNSINALVQYLKRKGLIRKVDDSYESPLNSRKRA